MWKTEKKCHLKKYLSLWVRWPWQQLIINEKGRGYMNVCCSIQKKCSSISKSVFCAFCSFHHLWILFLALLIKTLVIIVHKLRTNAPRGGYLHPNFYFIFYVYMCLISHRESFEKYLMVASISEEQQEVFCSWKQHLNVYLLSRRFIFSPGTARMSLIAIL